MKDVMFAFELFIIVGVATAAGRDLYDNCLKGLTRKFIARVKATV